MIQTAGNFAVIMIFVGVGGASKYLSQVPVLMTFLRARVRTRQLIP